MIDRIEKIQWAISGFIAILFVVLFFYPGLPKAVPDILAPIQPVAAEEFERKLEPRKREELSKKVQKASAVIKGRRKTLDPIRNEYVEVPAEIVEIAKDMRQGIRQMQLISGKIDPRRKTYRLESFKDGSYLPALGFHPGDEIEGIDGDSLEFIRQDGSIDRGEAERLYEAKKRDFESGSAIVITVNRGGKLVSLVLGAGDLNGIMR